MSRKFKSILDFLTALNDLYGSEYIELSKTYEEINKCTEGEKYIEIFEKFCSEKENEIKTQFIKNKEEFTFEFIPGVKVPLGQIITDKSNEPSNISTIWCYLQKIAGITVNRELIFINNLAREIQDNKDIISLSGDPSKILTDGSFQNIITKLTANVIKGFQTENLNIHSLIGAIQDMLPPQ